MLLPLEIFRALNPCQLYLEIILLETLMEGMLSR